jgi:hypothetical protein
MTDAASLPEPLVPADVDLRDFPFTPMFRSRLFGSSFHARVSDAGWRAGVTLWLKSWDQVPAGTLPDDDIDLCRLAELGRDVKSWRKVKAEALWGWMKCRDGRLHHHVVAEGVMEAWTGKLKRAWGTDCARIKKANQRNQTDLPVPTFEEWMSQRQSGDVPRDKPEMSPRTTHLCPEENGSNRKGERKGQGKGKGDSKILAAEEGAQDRDPIRIALDSIGAWDDPNLHIHGARVLDWIRQGADLDLDIVPTLKAVLAKARKSRGNPDFMPTSLNFFDQAVADAVSARTRPLPDATHGGAHHAPASDHQRTQRRAYDPAESRRRTAEGFALAVEREERGG